MNDKKKLIDDIQVCINEYENTEEFISPSGRIAGIFKSLFRKLKKLTFGDLSVLSGLGCMTWGLWLYKPWVSLTVLGVTLICMGVYPYIKQPK